LHEAAERAPEDVDVLGKLVKGLRLSGRTDEARSVLQRALFRNARSPRYRKLWNEFRFHQARRRHEAQQLERAENEEQSEQPVLLPFVRLVAVTSEPSDCPTIVRCEKGGSSRRSHRLSLRGEQRNVQ
jgi:hypothetical protein